MAASRPAITVYSHSTGAAGDDSVAMPCVMNAPIRPDIVQFVHTNMAKNSRQAYAVSKKAGHQTSAESWGTGRAVSRIPRVGGGGTQRSGQGAFGNMCRSGRMFGPTKTWRRWHRKINLNQKRYAMVSAIAASAVPSLVMARGHRIEQVPELPLVVDNSLESISKTADVVKALNALGAGTDCDKAADSKKVRAGKGKMRNRRYVLRRGPLVIHSGSESLCASLRNLPGVETANVEALNLLQLAPGGHMGRFCVWTKAAIEKLDSIYGTYDTKGSKSGYTIPRHLISNSDIARLINSDEVQSIVKPANVDAQRNTLPRKKNPLKNLGAMQRLSPYIAHARLAEQKAQAERKEKRAEVLSAKRVALKKDEKVKKQFKANSKAFYEAANRDGDIQV